MLYIYIIPSCLTFIISLIIFQLNKFIITIKTLNLKKKEIPFECGFNLISKFTLPFSCFFDFNIPIIIII